MAGETYRQEDFDQVVKLEGVIAAALFPFAANTPTRLAIFALGRVLKALLTKCDRETRAIYVKVIIDSIRRGTPIENPSPDIAKLDKFFIN